MKVSTQIPGVKIQAAKDSRDMFSGESQLHKIDLKMLDTQNVTDMYAVLSHAFICINHHNIHYDIRSGGYKEKWVCDIWQTNILC